MMKPEIKQKWIAALRSGDYVQGEGFLHFDGKYCCLGVLQEVVQGEKIPDTDGDTMVTRDFWSRCGSGWFEDAKELAEKNDDGLPFSDLANYIEENL